MNDVLVLVKAHKIGGASKTCSWPTSGKDSCEEKIVKNISVSEILH